MTNNYSLHQLLSEHADEVVQSPALSSIFYLLESGEIQDFEIDIVEFADKVLGIAEETEAEKKERLAFQKKSTSIVQGLSQKALELAKDFQKDPKKHMPAIKKFAQLGAMALGGDSKLGQFLRLISNSARKLSAVKEEKSTKTFKELRQNIHEVAYAAPFDMMGTRGRVGPQDSDNALDGTDINLSSLSGAAIARINTYLGALCAKPYIDPVAAIKQAQGRLQMIGLDIQVPTDFKESVASAHCEKMMPLVRFGGTYGMDGSSYTPSHTDGITPMIGHGFALRVETNKMPNGLTQVHAMVVPSA